MARGIAGAVVAHESNAQRALERPKADPKQKAQQVWAMMGGGFLKEHRQ